MYYFFKSIFFCLAEHFVTLPPRSTVDPSPYPQILSTLQDSSPMIFFSLTSNPNLNCIVICPHSRYTNKIT